MSIPLIPWYLPEDENVLSIAMKVHEWLEKRPDDVYVLAIMELGRCHGISIVYMDEDNDCVYWQVNIDRKVKYRIPILEGMKAWARSRGAEFLRLYTTYKPRLRLYRKYGFTPCEDGMEMALW